MKIYIDSGHGGKDPGAVGNNLKEKDLTLSISLKEKTLFEKLGHQVKMSRTSDKTLSLGARVNDANKWGADVFISNHINAGGGEGEEVWCSIFGGKGRDYATTVEKHLSKIFKSRGVKTKKGSNGDYFYVIRGTRMPAILVEFGFIDNKNDAAKLKNTSILQKSAEAVVHGVLNLPLNYTPPTQAPAPAPPTQVFNRYLKYKRPLMSGSDITMVQTKLKELGFNPGVIDGIFGRNSENAVKSFQRWKKISADGIIGPVTWNHLF